MIVYFANLYVWLNQKYYSLTGRFYSHIYKRAFKKCGGNLIIAGKPNIFNPNNIIVGDNVRINDRVELSPQEGTITICDNVTFSRGAQVVAGSLDTSSWSNEGYIVHKHIYKDVYIGDGAWLGINSIILPGVNITGKGVIVAAGAIVTHDIDEDYVIVAGIPASIVKHL